MINDKRWQDSSDGWVKTMHKSRIRKEQLKLVFKSKMQRLADFV